MTDQRRNIIKPQAEDVVYNGIRLISGILTQRISLEKPLAMIISLVLIGAACVIYTIAISSTMGFINARDLRVQTIGGVLIRAQYMNPYEKTLMFVDSRL